MARYRVRVELSKVLPQTNSLYTMCMCYIVEAGTMKKAKQQAEFDAKAENPTCRAKAYYAEELPCGRQRI